MRASLCVPDRPFLREGERDCDDQAKYIDVLRMYAFHPLSIQQKQGERIFIMQRCIVLKYT